MAATFTLNAWHRTGHPECPLGAEFYANFTTEQEARDFIAALPRYLNMRLTLYITHDDSGRRVDASRVRMGLKISRPAGPSHLSYHLGTRPLIRSQAAIRRYHSALRHLARLGAVVGWERRWHHSYPSQEAFEQALKEN